MVETKLLWGIETRKGKLPETFDRWRSLRYADIIASEKLEYITKKDNQIILLKQTCERELKKCPEHSALCVWSTNCRWLALYSLHSEDGQSDQWVSLGLLNGVIFFMLHNLFKYHLLAGQSPEVGSTWVWTLSMCNWHSKSSCMIAGASAEYSCQT